MDASKITELLQKQNTVYLNRSNTVDSSTMTWRNQIQHSKYIKGVATCTGIQNTNVPTQAVCPNGDGTFNFGGRGKGIALATGSSQHVLNVYSGAAGSAAEVYSSDKILLQKAGQHYCAELITDQDAYTILPSCATVNTNGPTSDNPNPTTNNQDTNPYLPPFDTYYKFKNPQPPVIDQNQKHYVQYCDGCVVEPVVTRYGWPLFMFGINTSSTVTSNSVTYQGDTVFVGGTFKGTIVVYDGNPTHTIPTLPTLRMTSATASKLDGFLIKYDQTGKIMWYTTFSTTTGPQTGVYNMITDATGVYVMGYMGGTLSCYHGATRDTNFTLGAVQATLAPSAAALFVVKYNHIGILQWTTMIDRIKSQATPAPSDPPEIQPTNMSQLCTDGTNLYVCNSIAPSPASIYVYSSNGLVAPSSYVTLTSGGANNSQQGFLVQYRASTGTVNWATRLTGSTTGPGYPGSSSAIGLICDNTQVYMTGYYNNTLNCYDASALSTVRYTVSNGSNNGMYMIAYNMAGVVQWLTHGTIAHSDFICAGVSLALDATGVYVAVPFTEAITFRTTPGGVSTVQLLNTGGVNTYNIGIVKYTLAGTIAWINKIMNVDNYFATVGQNGFSLSSDGSALYVTGGFGANTIGLYNSSTSGDPTPEAATLSTAGGDATTNAFLIKYNLLGALQWSTIMGHLGSSVFGYHVTSNTNLIYVTGTLNGPLDAYHANGLFQPTKIGVTITPPASTYVNSYVVRYTSNGQVILS